jgi:2-polyprenyl-3-methyl-5-hydroxy-6-metoxy-1,4-benzoquinol methylase
MSWKDDQLWEAKWWNNCRNTYGEETKQLDYAPKMGLKIIWDSQGPHIDMQGKTVLDIGGGPVSLLLKCKNVIGTVVDPCEYPFWVEQRYLNSGITYYKQPAEDIGRRLILEKFNEVWIYNVLQHVSDPELIVKNALAVSEIVRVFDWLEIGIAPGHPNNLTEADMNKWFGGEGKVTQGNGGKEYTGIFKGKYFK